MDIQNNKISIRQLHIMFVVGICSSIIRVVPKYVVESAKQASWLTPIISLIPFILLLFILSAIIKKYPDKPLDEIYSIIFGKPIGKVVNCIFILWLFVMLATYVRYFAERFESTILVTTPTKFFILTILICTYIVTRNKIKYFGRFNEFFVILFIIFILFSFIIAIPDMNIINFLPVTFDDTSNILYSTLPLLGIWSYITYIYFLNNYVSDGHNLKKHFPILCIFITSLAVISVLVTVGIFGANLTTKLNMAFFMFFKNINVIETLERLESLLISFWIVTDFTMLCTIIYILSNLIKRTFSLSYRKELVTPIVLITCSFSQLLSSNIFEIYNFSKYVVLPANLVLAIGLPVIMLIIGKIRKLI